MYFSKFFEYGWTAFYATCLGIHEFLQPEILEGEDMPSVLGSMKIMKENRDSIYCKSEAPDRDMSLFTPDDKLAYTTNITQNDFSSLQRTKDEDWKVIFELSEQYIKKLVLK